MSARTRLTFAAACGASLTPALRGSEAKAPLVAATGGTTVLIYASCADWLSERVEAGEAVSTALAHWIVEAKAVLTAYREARSNFIIVERRTAWAAPHASLAVINDKFGAETPEPPAIVTAPLTCGPVSRLIAQCALSQSPQALEFDDELAASAIAVTPAGEEAEHWAERRCAPDLDALAVEIRNASPAPEAYAVLQAEVVQLRDMLDHARRRNTADTTRLAEQARKIEAQQNVIRSLERNLGEAQGAVRQIQKWLQGATAT